MCSVIEAAERSVYQIPSQVIFGTFYCTMLSCTYSTPPSSIFNSNLVTGTVRRFYYVKVLRNILTSYTVTEYCGGAVIIYMYYFRYTYSTVAPVRR
jgi:hypothetical protein